MLLLLLNFKTSIDCGYFDDAIKSYHRLLDLKEKYVDIEVLRIICNAVENNITCANNEPIYTLKSKILQLYGRLVSLVC